MDGRVQSSMYIIMYVRPVMSVLKGMDRLSSRSYMFWGHLKNAYGLLSLQPWSPVQSSPPPPSAHTNPSIPYIHPFHRWIVWMYILTYLGMYVSTSTFTSIYPSDACAVLCCSLMLRINGRNGLPLAPGSLCLRAYPMVGGLQNQRPRMNGPVPVVTVTWPPLTFFSLALEPGGCIQLHTATKPGDSYESSWSPPLTSDDTLLGIKP